MIRTRAVASAAAMTTFWVLSPMSVQAATRPPENPVCVPLAATIGHWLPILDRTAPYAIPTGPHSWKPARYPWIDAAGAIVRYIPRSGERLAGAEAGTADSIAALGIGAPYMDVRTWRGILRPSLRAISGLCPSLPRKVADGPLPR